MDWWIDPPFQQDTPGGDDVDTALIRKNGIPLYVQVKNNILADIQSGLRKPGDQLPTERELSERLSVSRNTVSQAYQDLEADGILVSIQGRGTFICDRDDKVRFENRRDLLSKVIDVAIEEGLQLGFSIEEFVDIATKRAQQKAALLHDVQVVFIECNREQVEYFSRKLEFGGVHITPLLLEELKDASQKEQSILERARLVITTFFHLDEVQQIIGSSQQVIAVSLDPELETIVKVARIPQEKRVGLICKSDNFAGKVLNALRQARLDELRISILTDADAERVKAFVSSQDALIVSPGRRREIEAYCKRKQHVIEFVFQPDVASINLLRAALADTFRH